MAMTTTAKRLSDEEVRALVEGIANLPTPPLVFHQINRVVSDPMKSAGDVAALLSEDPAMSAKVLRMSNSAFYALPNPVSTVKQSVVILGMEAVRSLVLSASVMTAFDSDPARRERQESLWRHSLATAIGSRMLARKVGAARIGVGPDEAFSAGLLHDIGKMVILCNLINACDEIDRLRQEETARDVVLEERVLGTTHAAIGAILTEKWNLDEAICHAIGVHHSPDPEAPGLAGLLHVADQLAHFAFDEDDEFDAPAKDLIDPAVEHGLGISSDDLVDWVEQLRADYAQSQTFLEMASG